MSEIFIYSKGPKFVFFTNYKVMYSTFDTVFRKHFLYIKKNIDLKKIILDEYLKITVVRNPYDRLVSLFFDKCLTDPCKKMRFKKGIFLQPCQEQILTAYNKIKNVDHEIALTWEDLTNNPKECDKCLKNFETLQNITFDEFIEVTRIILERKDTDPHFLSQYDNLKMTYNKMEFDMILRMENIHSEWKNLPQNILRDIDLPVLNKTNHKKYNHYYSIELQEKVYRLYKKDFEYFHYQKEF